MAIDRETVRHVANLARLGLSEDELDELTPQLASIIDFFSKLESLDLEDVPPTVHAQPQAAVLRKDEPAPTLPAKEALRNAPDAKAPYFRVPKVIDPEEF